MNLLKKLLQRTSAELKPHPMALWTPSLDGLFFGTTSPGLDSEVFNFLEEEGLLQRANEGFLLPWDSCYQIFSREDLTGFGALLNLPEVFDDWLPYLQSHGGLSDEGFRIDLTSWSHAHTGRLEHWERIGSLVKIEGTYRLASSKCNQLIQRIPAIAQLETSEERSKEWGCLRSLALQANATLCQYLRTTVVLSPDQLRFALNCSSSGEIQVAPGFDGAPAGWLNQLDKRASIPNRIDVTDSNGDHIQIFLSEPVRGVLQAVKRQFPTRHLRGEKGRAFLKNPYSLLPEGADSVVKPESIDDDWPIHDMAWSVEESEERISGFQIRLISQAKDESRLDPIFVLSRNEFLELFNEARQADTAGSSEFGFRGYRIEFSQDPNGLIEAWTDVLARWDAELEGRLETRLSPKQLPDSNAPSLSWIHNALPDSNASLDTSSEKKLEPRPRVGVRSISDLAASEHDQADASEWKIPSSLKPQISLRPYQEEGVRWLHERFPSPNIDSSGVILADDMGLGKTIQCITFIASLLEQNPSMDPALVVAPVSLLDNWCNEVDSFLEANSVRVLKLHGKNLSCRVRSTESTDKLLFEKGIQRCLEPQWRSGYHLVLTSYEVVRDFEISLAASPWSVIILDEAQKIKNPTALISRAVRSFPSRFRIACTGTPVENSLRDLWSLFQFARPGYLGPLDEFSKSYRKPIEAITPEQMAKVEELRARIAPWILRRTKAEVAKDLPPKRFVAESNPESRSIHLSADQISLCSETASMYSGLKAKDPNLAMIGLFKALFEMRMICALAKKRPNQLTSDSWKTVPKGRWLLETLEAVRAKNEKVLIFTEFKEIQLQLRMWIQDRLGIRAEILNGSTATTGDEGRQERIKAFSKVDGFGILILGTKALGAGVNIQAANHVIHFTRSWNPAIEDQATDRAYRIGQTRPVYVYTPTVIHPNRTWSTFEERLDELLKRKRVLAQDILNGSAGEEGMESLLER